VTTRKKLIEVAMPLDAINEASRREKSPFTKGHPRALHVWWARRPLAACRAVIFASLVDDPSSRPEEFPNEESQRAERERLLSILEELVKWENSSNQKLLAVARAEIAKGGAPPALLDPFCGGGSIPLEAQRLGLAAYGSDLNPVAVLITKALIELPPKFASAPPVNPESRRGMDHSGSWGGAHGLATDVSFYGEWMRDEAARRIGDLYPKVQLPRDQGGGEATVVAWIWARTVNCPNPACGSVMPLVRSFVLSTKRGRRAWIEPIADEAHKKVRFDVKAGDGVAAEGSVNRRGARCLVCNTSVSFEYIRSAGKSGHLGRQLLVIVAKRHRTLIYLPATEAHERIAEDLNPEDSPDSDLPERALSFRVQAYGMIKHRDLFTPRQLTAMITLCDLVAHARARVRHDAIAAGLTSDGVPLGHGGQGADGYADAVATYLGLAVSRFADFSNAICSWDSGNTNLRQLFARQAIPMAWDFAETNPLYGVVDFTDASGWAASALEAVPAGAGVFGQAKQLDATAAIDGVALPFICTDPPYYDNIGYADLSDFFYVWLRRALRDVYPDIFSTLLSPKQEELIASPYRFGGSKPRAREFFEAGLRKAFERMREVQHPDYPLTLYYAFKQAEETGNAQQDRLLASTGWETMLDGLLKAGFQISGTWPMRTEQAQRSVAAATNALASSIVLVCRRRPQDAPLATRTEFSRSLKKELPEALKTLQLANIAPVDLAQAAIGPGMAVFSGYGKVLEADGSTMRVRTALGLINQALDEILTEHEADYDPATRWAVAWFDQFGMEAGPYGTAETLATAKAVAIHGLVADGFLQARAGKVRLLGRTELKTPWDPGTDPRVTVWEVTQHLIGALETDGEVGAGQLLRRVGMSYGELAKDLAYRLYTASDRQKWSQEALAYNGLVMAWPEMIRLAAEVAEPQPTLGV
jgi:putative DNA methylase